MINAMLHLRQWKRKFPRTKRHFLTRWTLSWAANGINVMPVFQQENMVGIIVMPKWKHSDFHGRSNFFTGANLKDTLHNVMGTHRHRRFYACGMRLTP